MKRFFGILTAITLMLSLVAVPSVMAAEAECEACYEKITEQDIIYNDDGEAMCIYCEEILSQKVLDALFYEESEENEKVSCQNCGEEMTEEEITYAAEGEMICFTCRDSLEEEEYYEGDDAPEMTELILVASDWAKAEVNEAYAANLIPLELLGIDLKTEVTRKEFAAIAVTLYERITGKVAEDSTENLPFTDCNKDDSYTRYIAAAYKLGVTNGISETAFAPEQTITREQLATMLFRVIVKAGNDGIVMNDVPVTLDEFAFDDDAQISDYAKESVYFMFKCGIIKGMSDVEFAPQGVATKEQAILISNRIEANLY